MTLDPIAITGIGLCVGGLALACYALAQVAPHARPTLGERGLERQELLSAPAASVLEPAIRYLAALIAALPLPRTRLVLQTTIERAGGFLGLSPDECLALCLLGAGSGAALALLSGAAAIWVVLACALGACTPVLRLHEQARARQRSIGRGLPAAIDLVALCMGAGLDFTGALGLVASEIGRARDPLRCELERVLQQLAIGRTRRQALLTFAARVPTAAVRDFVASVVQAEEQGNPLARVLQIQAQALRGRRSVAAEEAAARASVLLLLPLMLLLCALLLILFGPFLVNGMRFS
jgi:tight adherence protein C